MASAKPFLIRTNLSLQRSPPSPEGHLHLSPHRDVLGARSLDGDARLQRHGLEGMRPPAAWRRLMRHLGEAVARADSEDGLPTIELAEWQIINYSPCAQ